MKYLLIIIMVFPNITYCGESGVYEIYVSSFSEVKLKETKDEIKLKTKDFNQPIQVANIIEISTFSIVVIADKSIETLEGITPLISNGSIMIIGYYFYNKNGYIRTYPDFIKIKNYFIKKYKVDDSTGT